MKRLILLTACAAALSACAGRDPNPISVTATSDRQASCMEMQAEHAANEQRIADLYSEAKRKALQNGAVAGVGIFLPVLWFGLDVKGAAKQDMESYQARNKYLESLMRARGCPVQTS